MRSQSRHSVRTVKGVKTRFQRRIGILTPRRVHKPGHVPEHRDFQRDRLYARRGKHGRKSELEPIGLHQCRHTYAAFMIAAGVNAKALCSYMGHSSITVTLDRYGHLMPGAEREAAVLLDGYLERASEGIGAPAPGSPGGARTPSPPTRRWRAIARVS